MMKILLVSATAGEISPILEKLGCKKAAGSKVFSGRLKNNSVDVLVTGIGMTATAFYLGNVLHKGYDLALNLGLAGSFNRNLELGEIVNVMEDHFAELGAEDGDDFLTLEQMKLEGSAVIKNDSVIENKVLARIPQVTGITVNKVHGNEQSIKKAFDRFHPYTESMEGAAFLFACKEAGVPCAQIRGISNYVERRNREAWNIPLAVKKLNEKAIEILDSF
jgi:futalosine hydrolase